MRLKTLNDIVCSGLLANKVEKRLAFKIIVNAVVKLRPHRESFTIRSAFAGVIGLV